MPTFLQQGFERFTTAGITNPLILNAMRAIGEQVPVAEEDAARPAFHFRPPAQWMNDPNGTLYHEGWYHVFYQHNPYGDVWGNMHWGHARSRDLVRWEHLPVALAPSVEKYEGHVFSGCAAHDGKGRPVILYSSVGEYPGAQWAAHPVDTECLHWEKYAGNPVITPKANDQLTFNHHMQDPFVFVNEGRTFMVLCGGLGEERLITLHEASDDTLLHWEFRGIVYRVTDKTGGYEGYPECPNLFPLDGKFVLLHLGPVMYRVGDFNVDHYSFTPELSARLDLGNAFHATNVMEDEKGKILISWLQVRGLGWSGVLALPRRMKLDAHNRLLQSPVTELQELRTTAHQAPGGTLAAGESIVIETGSAMLEMKAEFERGT
ncbi:MAG: glycoside hydrolase family 32 protein, partial [Armatimonadota bacterium]